MASPPPHQGLSVTRVFIPTQPQCGGHLLSGPALFGCPMPCRPLPLPCVQEGPGAHMTQPGLRTGVAAAGGGRPSLGRAAT